MTLWSGRFSEGMDTALWELSESYSFDHVLFEFDIDGSRAHVSGLRHAGILTDEEAQEIARGLELVREEFRAGQFERREQDEDIHMAIERRLGELVGPVGGKVHTARSRNDQVVTALRLFTRSAVDAISADVLSLVDELMAQADRYSDVVLPGYTHLQRAQPVLLAHHFYAHAWALLRDVERLADARRRVNVSPLGAGALAGTSLPIDPSVPAKEMHFREIFANSLDAVSDRDFVAEALSVLALISIHLSRMGEELVLWTTAEFGFATLGDNVTTGSSMLPQKKNSDVAELARGKAGRVVGNLMSLLTTLKGLPLSYNRDLQEDKEPLFDSVRTVQLVTRGLIAAYRSIDVNVDAMTLAANDDLLVAIDIAEGLVEEGLPFRQAHELVGGLVGEAVRAGHPLAVVVRNSPDFQRFSGLFEPGVALARRRSPGAAGPDALVTQRIRLEAARRAAASSEII